MEDILLYFSYLHHGDWHRIYQSIERKDPVDWTKIDQIKQAVHHRYLTLLSPDYPAAFRHIECPPYVLYYRGNRQLLTKERRMAVVGSRYHSYYGAKTTHQLVQELVQAGWGIVSGLARGIDALAHQTCLDEQGITIAVLGGGIDTVYPPENNELYAQMEAKGLILSEYPTTTMAKRENFPFRNRLVAALSCGVVIIEARQRSGTLTTVRHALNQGKDIFCVPQQLNVESACNRLIQQGAKLILCAEDILEEFDGKRMSCMTSTDSNVKKVDKLQK